MDLGKGTATRSVPTGAGPQSVASDLRSGRVPVVNRTDANVSIVDPRTGTAGEDLLTRVGPIG
ncbi:hypothetical protein [Actinoallomurus iriomotensis]|uniref:Uncharacterized protein n=1 Tax=Actinoallomurus iriomotensis TaxID=478107 RepID=A0A9W6S4S2_9ACTN|nr:hypothetical protein [Actinoallomurus iriomotensis]GLY85737.1 hypothetical protein Airi02_036660 [Actinoallomurus iriomotensis]